MSPLFPAQETGLGFPQQEFDPSLFSNADFHSPGSSFLEQLEGDEEELRKKNSIIPEREIVEITPPSPNGLNKLADFTSYFGGRSNDLGNLTQPLTPNSRPRFSAAGLQSPHTTAKTQLFNSSLPLPPDPPRPGTNMTSPGEYISPDLLESDTRPGELLSKSNDLIRKVTSLLESKKFDANEFIRTLESEIQTPQSLYAREQHVSYQATGMDTPPLPLSTFNYERLPEHYLTPQPRTPVYSLHHGRDYNYGGYLEPKLSGDSLDSCNIQDIPPMLQQHSVANSIDDVTEGYENENDLTLQQYMTLSADDLRSVATNPIYANALQHSLMTNSDGDLREVKERRRNLSNTSGSYSFPEGLETLEGNPPVPSPPRLRPLTTRRVSREELAPRELTVDIEMENTTDFNCCIGGIAHTFLKLTNQSPCWVQTQLEFRTVKFLDNPIDPQSDNMPLSMYNRCILGTAKSEQVKITFAPSGLPGAYTVELDIFVSKIVDSSITKPSRTFSFAAEAIRPEIELVYQNSNSKVLDFGFVVEGKTYEQCVTLVNQSNCSLPIKIALPAKLFTARDLTLSLASPSCNIPEAQKETSHLSTVIEPAGEGVQGKIGLWIRFKPSRHGHTTVRSKSPVPPAAFSSLVEIFLDGPFASSASKLINSIPITANFAEPNLVILESIDTLRFETSVSRTLSRSFTLHNRGSIPITLTMELEPPSTEFMIAPYHISLQPYQQSPVTLSFRPSHAESVYSGTLNILYNPGDRRHSLKVFSRADPPDSPVSESPCLSSAVLDQNQPPPSEENYLLSNLLSLNWGATQLDECIERKIVLFNTSDVDLSLSIELTSQSFFVKDELNKYKSTIRMSIPARVKLPVSIAFAPTDSVVYSDNLSITDLSHNKVFQIPLVGYGGRSQILIVNAQRTSEGYWMSIGEVKRTERNVFKVYLLNNGTRKAYIKAVCKDNQADKPILPSSLVTVTPSEFLIAPQDYKSILVTFLPRSDHVALCEKSPHCLASVHLTTCDCMSAKIYFSQLRAKNKEFPSQFDYLNKLFGLDISEDEDFSQFPLSSHSLSPPSETEISVPMIGYPPSVASSVPPGISRPRPSSVPVTRPMSHDDMFPSNTSSPIGTEPILHQSPEPLPSLSKKNSDQLSRRSSGSAGSSSPKPVYHGTHSPSRFSPKHTQTAFTVYPSQLTINSDAREPAKLYIHNQSHSAAKFAVVFPKQFVTVSPARGSVDPGQEKQLLVSSLLIDMTDLPCSLTEYLTIHCEESVKSVPLNIVMESSSSPSTPVRESFASVTRYLSPPNILFSPIKSNSVADLPITISNPHNFPIHWSLSSMGQAAFQEQEEGSLEILKTNYAVFFFHRLSGGLASHGTSSISVTFQPKRPGTYSQSWEMQFTKGVKMIDGIKLSVSGKAEEESISVAKQTHTGSHSSANKETHNSNKPHRRRVYLEPDILNFPQTRPNISHTLKVSVYNKSDTSLKFSVNDLPSPFSIHKQHVAFSLDPRHCARLPIYFSPSSQGYFEDVLTIKSSDGKKLYALLKAESSFYPKL